MLLTQSTPFDDESLSRILRQNITPAAPHTEKKLRSAAMNTVAQSQVVSDFN
jgi:hypothetical protein